MRKTSTPSLILLVLLAGGLTAQEKTPDLVNYWLDVQQPSAATAALFRELSTCYDEIVLKDLSSLRVRPFQSFPGRANAFAKTLQVEDLARPKESTVLAGEDVQQIRFCEEIVLERVERWRDSPSAQSQSDKLRAAEEVLLTLARFHRSWRSAAPLSVNPWHDLEAAVAKSLLQARLDSLAESAKAASNDDERKTLLKRAASILEAHRE
ncbi:MAG: hypothetical protein L0215_02990, partial [Gemmataceae bacterium]|nr:hypothetical protein [Gemmataceae bacterium]